MHHRFVSLPAAVFAFLSLIVPCGAQGQDNAMVSPEVSFTEAVRIALSNAREVRLAAEDVRITAEDRNRAAAGRLPRLDASSDFTALSEQPSVFIQGNTIQTADQNIWRARLTAEQTIYDFGRTSSRVEQADARTDNAARQEEVARERQAIEVISAFLSAKRAEELRKVADESLATARDHRRVAGDQYDLGVVAKNDVLAADVQVANAEAGVITSENNVELARSRLALRMGYSGDRSVTPAPGAFPVPGGSSPPLADSLRKALEKRNELFAQGAIIREGEASVATARTEFTPTFFGQGGYSYEDNDLNPHKSVFSILVGGKVNLFSGFADEAALRKARLTVGRRKEVLGKLRDEIALEVKSAHLFVTEAEKRKTVAEVAVARADENLRIQNDRYKEGLSISTEVLDAQTLLTRAKVDRQNA
ncbi:MAG: TolC family protein, partial [Deltaproteobacteria bacterium]|nr:TolC family protein [Deltaproteobacteria bacterium]